MLRASNRVLKAGGVLGFFVISLPEGDRPESLREGAVDLGPEWVDPGEGYTSLMTEAGFGDIAVVDVTPEYQVILEAFIREWTREAEEIEALIGAEEVADRRRRRLRSLAAIKEGLLCRYLVTGVK